MGINWLDPEYNKAQKLNKLVRLRNRGKKFEQFLLSPRYKQLRDAVKIERSRLKTLNTKQKACIELMTSFHEPLSLHQIAAILGVNLSAIYRWRRDPLFATELDKEITRLRSTFRLEAHHHLFKRVKRGDPKAIREYLKMTGDLKENISVEEKRGTVISDEELENEIKQLQEELGEYAINGDAAES